MALGRPVVCTLNPGLYEKSELPVISASPAKLAGVLQRLIASPESRKRIGVAGRLFVLKHHNPDQVALRVLRAYREWA